MKTNARTVAEVGYLLVDVLRLWHSTIDCASFGLLSEVLLLMSVLAPFWLLASLHWWLSHPGFRGPKPGREHNHQVCWDQVSHI
jgi:hypothetical protein